MTPRWRHLQSRLAAVCAVCLCATSASAAGEFDYSVEPIEDVEATGTTVIEAIDPELCGSDLGWIERLEREFEARTAIMLSPVQDRVKMRKGLQLDYVTPGLDGTIVSRTTRIPTTVMVQYTGCMTPTGIMLLSFRAQVDIAAHDAPQRFVVTYEGPPLVVEDQFSPWSSSSKPRNFKVETDLGDTVVYGLNLRRWLLSAERIKDFSISLRLKSRDGSE
jgi:hypothetical protein